jgi:NAD(P)-dependent dehydrogenase (short-subunit alcohol dehydrogenase family)
MSEYEVVIYGASGYTGEHIMWKLTERGIPFIAAGRNKQRLEQRIAKQAELKDARYQVVEVAHDEEALVELLRGKKVVHNLVGPFAQHGETVVRAALRAGCHYIDASGEQDWKLMIRERYGKAFADKGLVLTPACAAMWLGGLLAAEAVLETPGIDSVDIVYAAAGVPSPASTLSFMRMACQPQLRLVQGKLEAWEPATHFQVTVPGIHEVLTGLPWSGGGESLFLQDDPRVINCQTLVAFRNRALMNLVISRMEEFAAKYAHLSQAEQEAATNKWALEIAPQGEMQREDFKVHRTIFSCHGRGTMVARSVALWGATGYVFAGVAGAAVIEWLVGGRQTVSGFQPATKVLGVPRLRAELEAASVLAQPTLIIQ